MKCCITLLYNFGRIPPCDNSWRDSILHFSKIENEIATKLNERLILKMRLQLIYYNS